MKNYKVEISELLSKTVEVVAESEDQALEKAKKLYYNEEVILGSDDYVDDSTEFTLI